MICFNAVYNATGNAVLSLVVSIIGCLVTGIVTGLINGFFVAKIGVSALIATIAANYAYQGIVFYLPRAPLLRRTPILSSCSPTPGFFGLRWFTPAAIAFVLIIAVVFFWMYKTRFGKPAPCGG